MAAIQSYDLLEGLVILVIAAFMANVYCICSLYKKSIRCLSHSYSSYSFRMLGTMMVIFTLFAAALNSHVVFVLNQDLGSLT